jgi:hypothetical protein
VAGQFQCGRIQFRQFAQLALPGLAGAARAVEKDDGIPVRQPAARADLKTNLFSGNHLRRRKAHELISRLFLATDALAMIG